MLSGSTSDPTVISLDSFEDVKFAPVGDDQNEVIDEKLELASVFTLVIVGIIFLLHRLKS